ncbi:MAG: hypothetical protein AAF502_22405 [Bacteroidota bacterium]
MKYYFSLLLILIATCCFVSCEKNSNGFLDFSTDAVNEDASFILSESGFNVSEQHPLGDIQNDLYTTGILEYTKNGVVHAEVEFGYSPDIEKAKLIKDGVEYELDLSKDKDKEDFYKLIVVPLVKADDCGFEIVSGMIKYYDAKTKMWVATVDFGDGTCDNEATKVTMDGISIFAVSDYF